MMKPPNSSRAIAAHSAAPAPDLTEPCGRDEIDELKQRQTLAEAMGVQQILTDETNGYGAKNVKDVKCNNGQNPTVKKGSSFDCDVSIDGTKRQVTVTFQDNKGTYEVGRPK